MNILNWHNISAKFFQKKNPPNFIGSELDAHQNVEWGLQLIPTHYHSDYDIFEIDLIWNIDVLKIDLL